MKRWKCVKNWEIDQNSFIDKYIVTNQMNECVDQSVKNKSEN